MYLLLLTIYTVMNGGAFNHTEGVSENDEVRHYYMCPYCHKHIPSAQVISHHQTHHKPEPEPEPEPRVQYANPQVMPSPTPPYGGFAQLQPLIQYSNPQVIPSPTPPYGFAQVQPLVHYANPHQVKPSPTPPHGLALNLAQVQPLIQFANPQMKPPSYSVQEPRIQSKNARKKPTPPLHGSAPNSAQEHPCLQYATPLYGLAPNPEKMLVPSSGESSSGKITSYNSSNKQTARFRYRPYPMHEKPKHDPAPFDLNVPYLGIPLSVKRTGPPVLDAHHTENTSVGDGPPMLDARRENTPAGDGPPVLDAHRENKPVGDGMADIHGSSSVRQPGSENGNMDLDFNL